MEAIKIKLEFTVDVEVVKKVLKERGVEVNMSNIKKVASVYKARSYSIKDKNFFDDFPRDEETLLMYGFRLTNNKGDSK